MDNILISSTEELSPEDRLLLACSKRQEPQGEEHAQNGDKIALQRTKSKLQASSSDDSDSSEDEEGIVYQNVNVGSNSNSLRSRGNACNMSLDSNPHSAYNTLIIHHNNNSLLADTWIPASHEFTSLATGSNRNSTASNCRKSQEREGHGAQQSFDYEALLGEGLKSNELSDIPRDYLNQLTVLKHLAKEVQQDPISTPPSNSKLLRSASFSRSQPDLSQTTPMSTVPLPATSASHSYYYAYAPPPQAQPDYPHYQHQLNPPRKKKEQDNSSNINTMDDSSPTTSTSVQMLEILMRENSNLRAELANARMRIQTIHKLESELTRLQKQHAALFESAERRESLERTARAKLSTEVKRLALVNRELLSSSNSLQNLSSYSLGSDVDTYRKELSKKDATIAQLISHNKELSTAKERQDVELTAQRATLEEQRTHIDILDSALTTAQGNVVRLEEECRRNQDYAEKVAQLQRALSSLQIYNEKREQSEKKLRSQLESEITDLKLQLASKNAKSNLNPGRVSTTPNRSAPAQPPPPPYPGTSSSNPNLQQSQELAPELQILQEKLRLSEDKIHSLTSVVQRWENFFSIEEKTPVTTPNTPNSWSSSRGQTPSHFNFAPASSSNLTLDDLPSTQNRAVELEWKIKDLESRLVEKDNMLRALNNANAGVNAHAQALLYSSPYYKGNHQASASLASMRYGGDPSMFYEKVGKCESEPPSYANLPPKLRLGGSGSSLAKNSNESLGSAGLAGGMSNNVSEPESVSSEGSNSKSIDEQLKELNTQLLSKGGPMLKMHSGLCCIPGFTHTSATTRKGKVPQPLLESLNKNLPPRPPQAAPSTTARTSSGPPFITPSCTLDSSSSSSKKTSPGPNVFTPVAVVAVKGLPPKSPACVEAGKCRSLERDLKSKSSNNESPAKFSDSLALDSTSMRCKSLDRRELKAQAKEEKEKTPKKSCVSSKAAFFGGLLSRRSPSPSRKKADNNPVTPAAAPSKGRFTFSRSQNQGQKEGQGQSKEGQGQSKEDASDQEIDTEFLDMQGRSSQRSRISKWTSSTSNLESLQEDPARGGAWVQRRSGGELTPRGGGGCGSGRKASLDTGSSVGGGGEESGKKWGKIVKSPFGTRYTFGAPRS